MAGDNTHDGNRVNVGKLSYISHFDFFFFGALQKRKFSNEYGYDG
jgi:hypothetical protein